MIKKHKIGGFTLIEIIAVLIILGILAAVATPKFMNMQRQARIAKLKELKAAMMETVHILNAKAELITLDDTHMGNTDHCGIISKNNPEHNAQHFKYDIEMCYGKPREVHDLVSAMDYDEKVFNKFFARIAFKGRNNCAVYYHGYTGWGNPPNIRIIDDGC